MNRHLQDGARDLEYGDDAEARTGNNVILHAFSSPLGNSVGLGFEKPQGHKMPFSVGKHLALEVAVGRAARCEPKTGLALDRLRELLPQRFRDLRVSLTRGREGFHDDVETAKRLSDVGTGSASNVATNSAQK
jgi:hypothetical protein